MIHPIEEKRPELAAYFEDLLNSIKGNEEDK